jgi:hypothetical protein
MKNAFYRQNHYEFDQIRQRVNIIQINKILSIFKNRRH